MFKLVSIILFSLFISSCENNKEKEIVFLIDSNNKLLEELIKNTKYEFDYEIFNKRITVINEIQKWKSKCNSINVIHKSIIDTNNIQDFELPQLIELNEKTLSKVKYILFDQIEDSIIYLNLNSRFNEINKNDLKKLDEISSKKLSESIKTKLLYNFFLFKNYQFTKFCIESIPRRFNCFGINRDNVITSLDKNIVTKGQTITLFAGIGQFNDNKNPIFYINNKKVSLNEEGIVEYKFIAPNKKGTQELPIKIIQEELDGSYTTTLKIIKYNIVDTICNN
jgi:hypothetical protein